MRTINNICWENALASNEKTSDYFHIYSPAVWYYGIWHDGLWKMGEWANGDWLNGTWITGAIRKPSKKHSGNWYTKKISPKCYFKPKLTISLNYSKYF